MPGSDSHVLLSGPDWHKRRRTQPSKSPDDDDSGDVLMVSRHWDRKEEKKTGGCWARSQSPGTVSLDFVKGWTNMCKEAPLGNLGLVMEDLA
jgi:hypothetical protein